MKDMDDMERKYWYWFAAMPAISCTKKQKMLELIPTPSRWYAMEEGELAQTIALTPKQLTGFFRHKREFDLHREYERLERKDVRLVTFYDGKYPSRLKMLSDPPVALFVRGKLPREDLPTVGIVGARLCSRYGRETAESLGRALAGAGVQVISGMAAGVDGEAQRGALSVNGGCSFGVLGCGPDICYPRENIELYTQLLKSGGILSEYPPGSGPLAYHFPARNRIISGLSDKLVVVEAREKSGSLITADQAMEQGRDVYAVPGRICDSLSCGCNQLIRQGAGILLSPEDFLLELSFGPGLGIDKGSAKPLCDVAGEEARVYHVLQEGPMHVDELGRRLGLNTAKLLETLLMLRLKGLVSENGRNFYSADN